ncbi:Protein SSUH2 like protein [Argiope bruennichi]|uniref:Protein SSUH2 like protein n=1 Tax=Argiope bruennichi TaxID=94029 RepID=A0A8T0E5M4_ARGBR|nr:Protein SSUH2 like protein [Argiope bruennichi]
MSLLKLTDNELRETLYKFSSEFCCYGTRFIREMILTDISDDSAFHYKLESFGEKRESTLRFTPYYGQSIDGPENGPAPAPWDVPVGVPIRFIEHRITTEIPHTARVETCTTCNGRKKVDCSSCNGFGTSSCSSCSGSGRDSDDNSCSSCGGSGSQSCWTCSGTGKVDCSTCDGYGKVKWFRLLIVTWTNHVDNFVSNKDTLSRNLIIEASGRELFNEQGDQVEPMTTAPDRIVNEASAVLIQKHNSSFLDELIIAQRHSLRAVPFTKATYVWRDKKGEFYVYGF